ncbi:hypothetical protein [Streptomyces sp. NPDC056296]|uniref:hypothetical protein n=1 Tax=Streptomyces sp. NPDC056296 TaxID=3345775 RepID=UPI0035E26943
MTKQTETDATAQAQQRVNKSLTALKIILLVAILRLLIGPATEDFLGDAVVRLPTWEWSLCALTPPALIFLCRNPDMWKILSYDAIYLKTSAGLYLFYATAFVYFRGGWTLWIAIIASLATFTGVWRLNRREHARAS